MYSPPHATDLEAGLGADSTATFVVDGVLTKAHLTKLGIVLRPLGVRRCWPLSMRVPSFVPFAEVLCVSTSQRKATWTQLCRCCAKPKVNHLPPPRMRSLMSLCLHAGGHRMHAVLTGLLFVWQVAYTLRLHTFRRKHLRHCHWTPAVLDLRTHVSSASSPCPAQSSSLSQIPAAASRICHAPCMQQAIRCEDCMHDVLSLMASLDAWCLIRQRRW